MDREKDRQISEFRISNFGIRNWLKAYNLRISGSLLARNTLLNLIGQVVPLLIGGLLRPQLGGNSFAAVSERVEKVYEEVIR